VAYANERGSLRNCVVGQTQLNVLPYAIAYVSILNLKW
jgi:hypothetical protein